MPTTRFAPSPTGPLHLGHIYAARKAWEAAGDGLCRLRIDDLDEERSRESWVEALVEDLDWLGLMPSEPWTRCQENRDAHQRALSFLIEEGLAYPCFCTRKEIAEEAARMASAPHGPDGVIYPGTCREMDPVRVSELSQAGAPYCWRLNSQRAALRASSLRWMDEEYGEFHPAFVDFGDVILGRKDGGFSYHLCVVVDDAAEGVDLVTRGHDLIPSTAIHVALQQLLGLPTPRYKHHGLVVDEDGKRLAKRTLAESVKVYRERGMPPGEVLELALARATG